MLPSNKGKKKQNKLWALVYYFLILSTIEGLKSWQWVIVYSNVKQIEHIS